MTVQLAARVACSTLANINVDDFYVSDVCVSVESISGALRERKSAPAGVDQGSRRGAVPRRQPPPAASLGLAASVRWFGLSYLPLPF